jgi:hypothetical protein
MRPGFSQLILCAIFPAIVAFACDSDDPVETVPPPAPVWSEITNLPSSTTFYALWAPRADLMIAVGPKGRIWQWDSQRWTQRVSPSADDLFAIDGSTTGNVIAVGNNGTVLEQVQGSFTHRDAHTIDDLRGAWRAPSGEFVITGMGGVILRGSGTSWSFDSSPTSTSLFSVWGSSESDVFAVGAGGTILHYDGSEWSAMESGTTELLSSVNGTAGDDVYAVGANGIVLRYDGASWTPMTSTTHELLQSVCAPCGPAAAGTNGTVIRLVDGAWKRETMAGSPWLYSIVECAGGEQWTVGVSATFRYDGVAWSSENRGMVPVLRGITSSTSEGLVAVGDNGITMLGGPSQWHPEDAGAVMTLNAAWTSPDNEIFAAGSNHIFRYTNDGWVIENQEPVVFHDVHGGGLGIFAVGTNGAIRRRIGTTWGKYLPVTQEMHAIHVTDDEAYAAGANGSIVEHHVGTWYERYDQSGAVLWDIMVVDATYSDAWLGIAVGAAGLCLGRDGLGEWTEIETNTAATLYALAPGPGGYLYAAGANGTVLRMVDDQWTPVVTPTSRTFLAAHSRSGALFLCGGTEASGGIILRYGPPSD